MPDFNIFAFEPPGPVAAQFIADTADGIPILMGPFQSGKTTTCVFKGPYWTTRAMPRCRDGVIRAKGLTVRSEYRALYRTTLPSWFQFFPKDYPGSKFTGGDDRPAQHVIRFRMPNGIPVEIQMDFWAIGNNRLEDLLRGYEASFAWLSECDLLDADVPGFVYGRLGRYPSVAMLPDELQAKIARQEYALPRQCFADMNPPDTDHWSYERCIDKPMPGYRLYRQPGGRSGRHENAKRVSRATYDGMAAVNEPHFVKRMVDGEFGYRRDGEPVYGADFSERMHVSERALDPVPGVPVIVGIDGGMGLHPAATFHQLLSTGQWRSLDELYLGRCGASRFIEALVQKLDERFPRNELSQVWIDPSAALGADKEGGEMSFVDMLSRALQVPVHLAPSNEPGIRVDAVRQRLRHMVDAATPGLIVDRRCKLLVAGYAAYYRFRRINTTGGERFDPVPEKNDHSHIHDSNQYAILGATGRNSVVTRAARALRAESGGGARPFAQIATGFNV